MKIKPIRDLYYRFIQGTEYDKVINAQDLALALHNDGKITLIPHDARPTIEHYRDTEKMKTVDETLRDLFIRDVIQNSLKRGMKHGN